jgi:predicted nuclease of predicted toxin-antitoxin system
LRILLDENMPRELADSLGMHEVSHVDALGLKSLKNGALLAYARERFEVLITLDRGILYQHNHVGSDLIVVVLRVRNSRKATILARSALLLTALDSARPGEIIEIGHDMP